MPYVSDRWLGGTLTNFRTIRNRLTRLEELETLRTSDEIGRLLQENAVGPEPRISQDVSAISNGMRTMNRLPECLVVIDPKKEKNAVSEARSWASRPWP